MTKVKKTLRKEKNRRMIYLFLATFFLSLFIMGFLIKSFSPSVDVEIGDGIESYEDIDKVAQDGNVDNRLKWIQFEDNMPGVSKRFENIENQDNIISPEGQKTKKSEKVRDNKTETDTDIDIDKKETKTTPTTASTTAPVPTRSDVLKQYNNTAATEVKMTKVYLGYYATVEQAIATQNKILNSDLNISPFVKEISGYYVVQVGSYANRQRAQELSNELAAMGYPVKLISE